MTPSVSVVLTTFNGATRGFLGEAVESVLRQTDPHFELLIIDDGSTDDTAAFCERYARDARVHFIRKANGGAASARNAGIQSARGGLICFLDDDDVWMPEKIALQRQLFSPSSHRPGLVYSAIEVIDRGGTVRSRQFHPVPPNPYRALFFENIVDATSAVMVSAEALRAVGNFREDVFAGSFLGCEDRELWSRLARRFPLAAISQPLVRYRVHDIKLSASSENMERGELTMLDLALSTAPPEVAAAKNEIYFQAYCRFASNRFTRGEYADFARHLASARKLGRIPLGLRFRRLLAIFPAVIPAMRRILSVMRHPVFRPPSRQGPE